MIQRARDLQDALNVLAKIKMQKETIATLCQQLVEKLPLELRQMIYEYIMPSRNVNVCDPTSATSWTTASWTRLVDPRSPATA